MDNVLARSTMAWQDVFMQADYVEFK